MTTSAANGLLRAVLIIGGAYLATILIALCRMKVLALLVGPTGVGVYGIYVAILDTLTTMAAMGLGVSGVREIALVKGDDRQVSRVRAILLAMYAVQGCCAAMTMWLLGEHIAAWIVGERSQASQIRLLGLAALLILLTAPQIILLQGLGRIRDLGGATVLSAFAGTVGGLLVVWSQGESGIAWMLLIQAGVSGLVVVCLTLRLSSYPVIRVSVSEVWKGWRLMAGGGILFMLAALGSTTAILLARTMVAGTLGFDQAGYFAASWEIAIHLIGFLATTMALDYYPRLTQVIRTPDAATRLMNEQTQLGLIIGGPLVVLLIGLAPWVMTTLYSKQFSQGVDLLQWQAAGNVLKLASLPLAFTFVSSGRAGAFLGIELSWNVLFLGILWIGLPWIGLEIAGIAFLLSYAVYLALLYMLVRRQYAFRWEPLSVQLICGHALLAGGVLMLARTAPVSAAIAGSVTALAAALVGLRIMAAKAGQDSRLAAVATPWFATIRWPLTTK